MSAEKANRGSLVNISSNVYTAMLALALGAVLATCLLVAFQCFVQYETIFRIAR
jgi:hypothetical protein